tara:strand:- start:96 stop:302 length:207 start_codon:yes stop_codon:yes gene_type:complete
MEKNSRVEVGKTPAEDGGGEPCKKIVKGNPVLGAGDNCFDKVANLVYKHTQHEFEPKREDRESRPKDS